MPRRDKPFPGLRPFQPEDAEYYFGRDTQREELLERLRTHRFLAVVGTSGSGKSSLVRAGLIPDLTKGYLDRGGPKWRVIIFTPGNNPFAELASELARSFSGTDPAAIRKTLQISSSGLNRFVRDNLDIKSENLLLIVDQFEELIRYSSEEAAAFVRMLLASTGQERLADTESLGVEAAQDLPIYVVLTMRSDFLGKCARFRGLPEALNDNQYLVPRLTRDEQREVIESPIEMAGARIAPRLVQRLLNDVGDNPDQLPVLQHALMRTWKVSALDRKRGLEIDIPRYEAIGGMQQALNLDADRAFGKLKGKTEQELAATQLLAKRIFQRLVEPGNIDEETRRPTPVSELVKVTGAPESQVRGVIEVFRSRGFLTLSNVKDPIVDIPHESLIRLWAKLKQWVKEERESSETYLDLVKASTKGLGFHRGVELLLALNWQKRTQPNPEWAERYTPEQPGAFDDAIKFLKKSRKAKRKRLVLYIAGATVVAGALLYATVMSKLAAARIQVLYEIADRQADENEKLASENKEKADANEKLARENEQKAKDNKKLADEARTQAKIARTAEAKARNEAENADRLYQIARAEQAEAFKQRDLAEARGKTDKAYREGVTRYLSSDPAGAIGKFEEALKSYQDKNHGDREAEAVTFVNIGMAYAARNSTYDAIDYFQDAIDKYEQYRLDTKGKAFALVQLGNQYLKLVPEKNKSGELSPDQAAAYVKDNIATREDAIKAYDQALTIYKASKDSLNEADVAGKIANAYKADRSDVAALKPAPRQASRAGQDEKTDPVAELKKNEPEYNVQEINYLKEELSACRQSHVVDSGKQTAQLIAIGDELVILDEKSEAFDAYWSANEIDRKVGSATEVQSTFTKMGKVVKKDDPKYKDLTDQVESYFASDPLMGGDPFRNSDVQISDFYWSVGNEERSLFFAHRAVDKYLANLDLESTDAMYGRIANLEWKQNQDAAIDAIATLDLYKRLEIYPSYRSSVEKTLTKFVDDNYAGKREDLDKAYTVRARKDNDKRNELTYKLLLQCSQQQPGKRSNCFIDKIDSYRTSFDPPYQLVLLMFKGRAAMLAQNWPAASDSYNEALKYAMQRSDSTLVQIQIRYAMADLHAESGAVDRELEDRLEAAKLCALHNYKFKEAENYYGVATTLDGMRQYDQAIVYYKKSYTTVDEYYRRTDPGATDPDQARIRKLVLDRLVADYDQVGNKDASIQIKNQIAALGRTASPKN